MRLSVTVVLATLMVVAVLPAFSDAPVVERMGSADGWINWERLIVKAVGRGALPGDAENPARAASLARAAAITDAQRNLSAVISSLRVTGETDTGDLISRSDAVRTKIEELIQQGQVVSVRQLSDRSFEAILQSPMTGNNGILSALDIRPSGVNAESDRFGLIIDARGLNVKPSICPRICREDGLEIYGMGNISCERFTEFGAAAYFLQPERAVRLVHQNDKPLIVKALRRSTKSVTDIVLSRADAERLQASGFNRVSIVINPLDDQSCGKGEER